MIDKALNILEIIIKFLTRNTGRVSDPMQNRFFSEIQRHRLRVVPLQEIEHHWQFDRRRTLLYRNMLWIKLKVREDKMKEATEKAMKEKTICREGLLECIEGIVGWYEKERKLAWVPEIVIQKFNERHTPHAEILMRSIDNILLWHWFSTKKEQMNAILYSNLTVLYMTYWDVRRTLGELNGEIDSIL